MKTKKGMASLYLVAFTTLLLGIVTMSFARVMISESREASNSDLSQSAFDSALAGIEDAKTAILMYEVCSNPNAPEKLTTSDGLEMACKDVVKIMQDGFNNGYNCDTTNKIVNKNPDATGEVIISKDLDQAYTCVPIAEDSPTYQANLTENTRSRVIDAGNRIFDGDKPAYDEIKGIELQWYTPETELGLDPDLTYMYYDATKGEPPHALGTKENALGSYPILNFELFQTDQEFRMFELDLNNDDNTGTNHAMIMLYPDNGADKIEDKGTFVSKEDLLEASNKSNQAAQRSSNYIVPKPVSCEAKSGARCRTTIEFPPTYNKGSRAQQTFMFRVSLPYGAPGTDFSIQPCTEINEGRCTKYATFRGAQYIVDSTGRASTLYRRIIARVETVTSLIFPEYAVQTSGENSIIEKNFWVTENCWMTDGKGNSTKCANNGKNNSNFEKVEN